MFLELDMVFELGRRQKYVKTRVFELGRRQMYVKTRVFELGRRQRRVARLRPPNPRRPEKAFWRVLYRFVRENTWL